MTTDAGRSHLDQLRALKLDGMAQAFLELEAQEESRNLTHPEWLALLLDRLTHHCEPIGGMPVGYDREFDDEQQRYWPRQQADRERSPSKQFEDLLSQPGRDFAGGEFVLTEQRPRMQSRAEVVALWQGGAVIFPVHHRPVEGTRGTYRVNMRHGVSRLHSGRRHTLGIIFHDAN